ncbi:MAG: hypothetical protein KME17_06835 [Cyanosarcina radialis HA8281-LM2]|jgi:hypothetical protein|nr:hypothetical protein [Cyanosarcina radialis HA8281-LM2]
MIVAGNKAVSDVLKAVGYQIDGLAYLRYLVFDFWTSVFSEKPLARWRVASGQEIAFGR